MLHDSAAQKNLRGALPDVIAASSCNYTMQEFEVHGEGRCDEIGLPHTNTSTYTSVVYSVRRVASCIATCSGSSPAILQLPLWTRKPSSPIPLVCVSGCEKIHQRTKIHLDERGTRGDVEKDGGLEFPIASGGAWKQSGSSYLSDKK